MLLFYMLVIFTNWMFNFLVSMTFLPVSDSFGKSAPFVSYAVFSAIGVGFIFKYLPETRGVPLEQIGQLFSSSKSDKVMLVQD